MAAVEAHTGAHRDGGALIQPVGSECGATALASAALEAAGARAAGASGAVSAEQRSAQLRRWLDEHLPVASACGTPGSGDRLGAGSDAGAGAAASSDGDAPELGARSCSHAVERGSALTPSHVTYLRR